ncbi:MAG: hypothetical protein IIC35_08020 [Gemmatimonadetes bacterium]|nr:hypothetical protein [Gemmatimonadota bacterium]
MQEPPRNRAWRRLHLAVDAQTGEILASDLTFQRTHDATRVPLSTTPDNQWSGSTSAIAATPKTRSSPVAALGLK